MIKTVINRNVTVLFFFLGAILLFSSRAYPIIPGLGPPGGQMDHANIAGDMFGWDGSHLGTYDPETNTIKEFWNEPNNSNIIDLVQKCGSGYVYVITTRNDIYRFDHDFSFGENTTPVFIKHLSTANFSEDLDKIIGDALYILSSSYVYISRDDGYTWDVDSAGLGAVHVWDIAVDSSQVVYAATSNGLFIQSPDSNVWRKMTSYAGPQNLIRVFLDRRNRILVGVNGPGIYLSTDAGAIWSVDTAGINNKSVNKFGDDRYGNIYAVASGSIYKSAGGTGSWVDIGAGIVNITINDPGYRTVGGDSLLYASTQFGIYVSANQGGSWAEIHNNLPTTVSSMAKMTNGRLVVSTGLGLFYKDPAAANWIKSYPASGYQRSLAVYTDGSGAIYTLLPNPSINARTFGSVLKSTDGGSSWNPDTAGLSVTTGTLFYVDETGVQHMASTYYGGSIPSMLYAKMPGNSWAADTMGFTSNTYNFSSSFGSDKHGYLYSSGYYGGIQMYRRPISGGAWVADTAGLSGINYFYSMVADGSGGMYGYASSGIYRRAAGVWAAISLPAGLTLPSPSQISVDSSGALFASFTGFNFTTSTFGSLGVYFTTDAGVTWTHAGADEGNVLQLISFGDTTYALASGEAYILTRTAALGVNGRTAQPTAYALHQNYPNPFNPAATISYDVQAESRVTLAVYNTLGQLVARLVDGMQSAGTHTAHFDGANLPSGVYFYRLEAVNIADPAKSFIQTKKMALVK